MVYATGYNADIRGIRHKYYIRGIKARGYPQISMAYDPRIVARNLAHSLLLDYLREWKHEHARHNCFDQKRLRSKTVHGSKR